MGAVVTCFVFCLTEDRSLLNRPMLRAFRTDRPGRRMRRPRLVPHGQSRGHWGQAEINGTPVGLM